jgi:hypothetical protein
MSDETQKKCGTYRLTETVSDLEWDVLLRYVNISIGEGNYWRW